MIDRRTFIVATSAAMLTGCNSSANTTTSRRPSARVASEFRPVPNAGFEAWVRAFRSRAAGQGLSQTTLDRGLRGAGFLPGVVQRDRNQAEFKRSFEDYLALVASETKVSQGRAAFRKHRRTLEAIEARYGVNAELVAAIWGVESNFGTRRGDIPTISAVATLAYDGRRGSFFEKQLVAALRILQSGDVTPENMTGSWAGAMGHTQFIPTSYQAFAVDFTGDGKRDIWSDNPADALASAAAYLARNGWSRGGGWSREDANGNLQPDPGGPRFLTRPNFRVIKRYNNSDNYALAVGYLADRIAGGDPLRQSFGPDRYGLTQTDRIALQNGLNRAGFDVGTADGVLGPKTLSAIEAYQRSSGLAATGTPSPALLARLN